MSHRQWVFVVRLHVEASTEAEAASPVLRGSLQVVGTDTVRYFDSLDSLNALLRSAVLSEARGGDGSQP